MSKQKEKARRSPTKKSSRKTPKPRNTLGELQILALLEWIAEGLTIGEINSMAASFSPPFKVSDQHVYEYRKSREIDLQKLRATKEAAALTQGLALKANRIKALEKLARSLENDIHRKKRLWMSRTKSIIVGPKEYEKLDELEFIAPLVKELRGVYDDIAKETGGRILRADLTSNGKQIKGYVGISPDDWDDNKTDKKEKTKK